MTHAKPLVVFFGDAEMIDLVKLALQSKFEVSGVTDVTSLDDALDALRQIKPDYVLVDPHLPNLDQRQLHRRLKADQELEGIQILIVRDGGLET